MAGRSVLRTCQRGHSTVGVGVVLAAAALVALCFGATGDADGAAARSSSARPPTAVASGFARTSDGQIAIDKGAAFQGYTTKQVTIERGGALTVTNHDSMAHTVTSVDRKPDGKPLFDTVVQAGRTVTVAKVHGLAPGRYAFYCRYHPVMRGTLVVAGSGGGGHHPAGPRFRQPLKLPRVITRAHPHLVVSRQPVRVLPHGPKTMMWTYGGSYPAPTLRRPAGHDTRVTFTDDLPASTGPLSVHLHGDHHAAIDDGQPTTYLIDSGTSRVYDYPLRDAGHPTRSTLDFYHDHVMGVTGRNNWYGMQGMFQITSRAQTKLHLPAGRYDLPLMLSDRTFDAHNQLVDPYTTDHPVPDDGIVGQQILVDGRFAPYLKAAAHRYRLRLLNSSNFTSYDLELSDGRPFAQIGNGDGLFAHPVTRRDILLGPAQTADVVVDFRHELGRNVVLSSVPRVSDHHHGTGTPAAPLMQFRVSKRAADGSRVPDRLQRPQRFTAPKQVSFHWVLGRSGTGTAGLWTINGAAFDPQRVDVTVPLGSTRTWEISNPTRMTHYVHLHEEEWHTISRDRKRPPPWERGLEDTWRLDPGESITVAAHFTDYPGVFMIHCHMLDHEDDGMMAQFAVLAPGETEPPAGFYLPKDAPEQPEMAMDAGSMDAGSMDAGSMDAGSMADMSMAGTSG